MLLSKTHIQSEMWAFILMIVTSYHKMAASSLGFVLVLKDHKMAVAAHVKRRKKEGKEAVSDNTFTRKTEAFPELHHNSLLSYWPQLPLRAKESEKVTISKRVHCCMGHSKSWQRMA